MLTSTNVDLCCRSKEEFDNLLVDTLDVSLLKDARHSIGYKRYLTKDEKARRKQLIDAKITEIESNTQVEEYQQVDDILVVENVINNAVEKPTLPDDAPIAVVLFAGGGGVECGMVEAGIRPVISVEFDPDRPELSDRIADAHEVNFAGYGGVVIRKSVQQVMKEDFAGFPRNPDYLHSSNVCKSFSSANGKASKDREKEDDIQAALATAAAITTLQPKYFTLEQVPGFKDSNSLKIILDCLAIQGYKVEQEIINLADYGVPQARNRLFLRAGKETIIPMPPMEERKGWYEAVEDLIPSMEDSALLPDQKQAIAEFLKDNINQPLLIGRVGRCSQSIRTRNQACFTLIAAIFTDQNLANRSKFADIVLPDGTVKSLSIEAAARLQSFPAWYQLPADSAIAGTIIGNSVPPLFAAKLFASAGIPHEESLLRGCSLPLEIPQAGVENSQVNERFVFGERTFSYALPTISLAENPTPAEVEFVKLYAEYGSALAGLGTAIGQLGHMEEGMPFAIETIKSVYNQTQLQGFDIPPFEGWCVHRVDISKGEAQVTPLHKVGAPIWIDLARLTPCRSMDVYDHVIKIRDGVVDLYEKVQQVFNQLCINQLCGDQVIEEIAEVKVEETSPVSIDESASAVVEIEGRKMLLLSAIQLDPDTQSRVEINLTTVQEYQRDRAAGAEFPAVVVFHDENNYYLGDGWHRVFAENQAGSERILADIRQGNKRDAQLYSCAANANHGLRRTSADKQKSVLTLLKDDEWGQWSNREIARRCGVDEATVRKYRNELAATGERAKPSQVKFTRKGETQVQPQKPGKEIFPRPVVISSDCPVEAVRGQSATATCRPNNQSIIVEVSGGERVTIPCKFIAEVQAPPAAVVVNSVSAENKVAARSLGLNSSSDAVLPDIERNEGIEVNFEAIAKMQAAINVLNENCKHLTQSQTASLIGLINFSALSKQQAEQIRRQLSVDKVDEVA
jgi:DNA (cytosine-5)-methyltransferase 1